MSAQRQGSVDDTLVIRGLRPLSAVSGDPDRDEFEKPRFVELEITAPAHQRTFQVRVSEAEADEYVLVMLEDGCRIEGSGEIYRGTIDEGVMTAIAYLYCSLDEPKGHFSESWRKRYAQAPR